MRSPAAAEQSYNLLIESASFCIQMLPVWTSPFLCPAARAQLRSNGAAQVMTPEAVTTAIGNQTQ
jgi:hypothetical protein